MFPYAPKLLPYSSDVTVKIKGLKCSVMEYFNKNNPFVILYSFCYNTFVTTTILFVLLSFEVLFVCIFKCQSTRGEESEGVREMGEPFVKLYAFNVLIIVIIMD